MSESPDQIRIWHCPKCGAKTNASGVVESPDPNAPSSDAVHRMPLFQCDSCVVEGEVFGVTAELAYTWVVAPGGRVVDAASLSD